MCPRLVFQKCRNKIKFESMSTTVAVLRYEGPVFVSDGPYCLIWGCIQIQFPKLFFLSQPKHIILRPSRGRRPNSVSTPILILRTPRSLYSHSTRIWYNLPHHLPWKREEGSIWKPRNDLCHTSNWITRICSMSPSYIHSRNRRWHTSLLYISNNNHCRTNRN